MKNAIYVTAAIFLIIFLGPVVVPVILGFLSALFVPALIGLGVWILLSMRKGKVNLPAVVERFKNR